jgi:hypothetical protein
VIAEFSGREASIDDIKKLVLVETAFRETHYKGILKALERTGQMKIVTAAPGPQDRDVSRSSDSCAL